MPKSFPSATKRVLIFRLGSLGDTLVALPALRLIARAFPEAERRMLTTFPPDSKAVASSAILDHTGLVHGYFRFSYGVRDLRKLLSLWWQIVRWRPSVLVYLGGDKITLARAKRDARFFRLCGIRRMVGVPTNEAMLRHRRRMTDKGEVGSESEAGRLVRNLAELGDGRIGDHASWDIGLTPEERARAAEILQPLAGRPVLAVSIGTKMQAKDWGKDNWHALLERVARLHPEYGLVFCGARDEYKDSECAAAVWRQYADGPVSNQCGKLTARESGAVLERAIAFVGHDSGPMHLAAAVGTPSVAIFSARDIPNIWFPHGDSNQVIYHHVDCAGCRLETCVQQKKKCILSITVDEVLAGIEMSLSEARNRHHSMAL